MLDAIGAVLATLQHRYTAYGLFAGAIVMVGAAIWAAYRGDHRITRGREELGRVLVELSECEVAAYDGTGTSDYDALMKRIRTIKANMAAIGKNYLDSSIESRFLAVNVFDVQLDEATRMHFISRAQGSFWTAYQLIRGWRSCVVGLLQELRR